MKKTILYIDGENLRHYIEKVLEQNSIPRKKAILLNIDILGLFNKILQGIRVNKKFYYSAKIKQYQETLGKSQELIRKQRALKAKLEKQGFVFIASGHVRPQKVVIDKKSKIIFREKGVDVKIGVDLVSAACDKKIETAIVCSSDSDLQPAIQEIKKRKITVIYLGFEFNPNKGLMYTADRTILIRNSEILEFFLIKS